MLPLTPAPSPQSPPRFLETFRGFVKNKNDAKILVEACIAGYLFPLNVIPVDLSCLKLQSGTVIVFSESTSHTQMMRWRDGAKWSPSRVNGQFLLYREVESSKVPSTTSTDMSQESSRFNTPVPRPGTRLVVQGFAKRTISITGSDGHNYRVISYFYPKDVSHLYGDDHESDDVIPTPGGNRLGDVEKTRKYERHDIQIEPLKTPAQHGNLAQFSEKPQQQVVAARFAGKKMATVAAPSTSPTTTTSVTSANWNPQSPPLQYQQHYHQQYQHPVSSAQHQVYLPRPHYQEEYRPSSCYCGGMGLKRKYNPEWDSQNSVILRPIVMRRF
ncbi:Gti1/Pac2 family-domain-containing protein [Obelidium mucronatum]|nr:Gti1/Pac2 family-domain-containing protein [Obelidium mucronatum]